MCLPWVGGHKIIHSMKLLPEGRQQGQVVASLWVVWPQNDREEGDEVFQGLFRVLKACREAHIVRAGKHLNVRKGGGASPVKNHPIVDCALLKLLLLVRGLACNGELVDTVLEAILIHHCVTQRSHLLQ